MSRGARDRADALRAAARATPGFLDEREGECLATLAERAASAALGPLLEIGSYLGRSTLYLAAGLAAASADGGAGTVVYSLDHHHGSEELQAGWPDHDPALVDPETGRMDTLARWRRRIESAGAEDLVVGVIGTSEVVAANWTTPLGLVFVDGGHGEAVAWADYRGWSSKLAPGGLLVFHDVFPDPRDGGRPPYDCYRDAIASGRFDELDSAAVLSLRALVARTASEANSSAATPRRRTSSARSTAAAE